MPRNSGIPRSHIKLGNLASQVCYRPIAGICLGIVKVLFATETSGIIA